MSNEAEDFDITDAMQSQEMMDDDDIESRTSGEVVESSGAVGETNEEDKSEAKKETKKKEKKEQKPKKEVTKKEPKKPKETPSSGSDANEDANEKPKKRGRPKKENKEPKEPKAPKATKKQKVDKDKPKPKEAKKEKAEKKPKQSTTLLKEAAEERKNQINKNTQLLSVADIEEAMKEHKFKSVKNGAAGFVKQVCQRFASDILKQAKKLSKNGEITEREIEIAARGMGINFD